MVRHSTTEYNKEWRKNNPDKVKECSKRYYPKKIRWTPSRKRIQLKENPRSGVCSQCKRKVGDGIKRTAIHHISYHPDDPLKDTIELCPSCHTKQHPKQRNKKGQFE